MTSPASSRSAQVAAQLSGGVGHLMKKNKITVFMGNATVPAKGKVSVANRQGHRRHVPPRRRSSVATGARARELPGLEADGDLVWTYRHALQPKRMPKKLLVIGSGAIGIEFALLQHAWRRHHRGRGDGPHPAGRGCGGLSAFARKQFVKQGMKILEKAAVKKLDRKPGTGVTAHIEIGGKTETMDVRHGHFCRGHRRQY